MPTCMAASWLTVLVIDYGGFDKDTTFTMYYSFDFCEFHAGAMERLAALQTDLTSRHVVPAGHFVNAWMYVWAWQDRTWTDWVVVPEYFNVVGALLYRYGLYAVRTGEARTALRRPSLVRPACQLASTAVRTENLDTTPLW